MKLLKVKKFRKKLKEHLELKTNSLFEDLKPYHQIIINSEKAAFIEVSFPYGEVTWKGFQGSICIIFEDNTVISILEECGLKEENYPILSDISLVNEDLTDEEKYGFELEDITLDEFAKWFSKVWKMEKKSSIKLPVFVSEEDPTRWFNIQKEKWVEEPFPTDEDGNWVTR